LGSTLKKKGGEIIRYTTWPLGPHRFLNNKDGLKTWLSDDNTKEDGVERGCKREQLLKIYYIPRIVETGWKVLLKRPP
jgi:hypothetical protein